MQYVTYVHDRKRGLIYCCKYYPNTRPERWKLIKVLCADHRCTDCPATDINNILDKIDQYFVSRDTRAKQWKEIDSDGQSWTVTLV